MTNNSEAPPREGFFIASLFWGIDPRRRPLEWGIPIRSVSAIVKRSRRDELHAHIKQMKLSNGIAAVVTAASIGAMVLSCGPSKPRQADLPKQPDRWVSYVKVDPESKVLYIGKTRNLLITDVSEVKELNDSRPIKIGDTIN